MINLLISGALGRMGKKVYESAIKTNDINVVCGIDVKSSNSPIPVYTSFNKVKEKIDGIIDFSSHSNLDNILEFALKNKVAIVLCATGYTEEDILKIENASKKIPVFRSANMSLGVNVLIDLVEKATKTLEGFDIEILEKHHNKKKDAPSGTALMIYDKIKTIKSNSKAVYGRNGKDCLRDKSEVGIHAIRGGNIVGDHDVFFIGENEIITLSHRTEDRSVFSDGAINAIKYLSNKKKGLFNMSDLINGR